MKKLNNYPVLKFSIYYIIYFLIWLFFWKISPIIDPPKEDYLFTNSKIRYSFLEFTIKMILTLQIYLIPFLLTFIRITIYFFKKSIIFFLIISTIANLIIISKYINNITIYDLLPLLFLDLSIFLICFIIKFIFIGRQP